MRHDEHQNGAVREGARRAALHVDARRHEDRASADAATVARAATCGAVATLLVDVDQRLDGTVDERIDAVAFADGEGASSYGVVDEIARRVLLTGGRVLAVRGEDVPGQSAVAAIFRHTF